jgi:hypothetical protein
MTNIKRKAEEIRTFLKTAKDVAAFSIEWFCLVSVFLIGLVDTVLNEVANWLMKKAESLNRRRLNTEGGVEVRRRNSLELLVSVVTIAWPGLVRERATASEVVPLRPATYPANEADASPAPSGAAAASVVGDGEQAPPPVEEPGSKALS